MVTREWLIYGIREQRDGLKALIQVLDEEQMEVSDACILGLSMARDVEKQLREIRKIATEELIKEIRFFQPATIKEEYAE